jgi:predicted phosphodiesterase
MLLIGDVHGLFYEYRELLKQHKPKYSLQLGDMGVGFPQSNELILNDIPGDHKWIRGNHDNPSVARAHPNYVGDYGILKGSFINGFYDKLFYIGGAWSIDWQHRTEGISIWHDEQLSQEELSDVVNLYNEEKPEVVCSHDCPTFILNYLHPGRVIPTRTSQAMDVMFLSRKPSYWVFAHHHLSWRKKIDGCTFICLNELECLDISKRITKNPQEETYECID